MKLEYKKYEVQKARGTGRLQLDSDTRPIVRQMLFVSLPRAKGRTKSSFLTQGGLGTTKPPIVAKGVYKWAV